MYYIIYKVNAKFTPVVNEPSTCNHYTFAKKKERKGNPFKKLESLATTIDVSPSDENIPDLNTEMEILLNL